MMQEQWYEVGYRTVEPNGYEYFNSINLSNGADIKGMTVNNFYCFNARDGGIRVAWLRFNVEYVFCNQNTGWWYVEGRVVNNATTAHSFDTIVCSYTLFLG